MVVWAVFWNIRLDFTFAQSMVYTFAATLFLLISLSSFYLPTHFKIGKEGVSLKRWFYVKTMTWERIRSVKDEKTGLFVSPFPARRRLENFRGIYLYYKGNRDEIMRTFLEYKPEITEITRNGK